MQDPIVQVDTAPGAVLRQKASLVPAADFGSRGLKTLITKMKKALAQEEYGVAIAAPQVGSSLRIFIVAGRVFNDIDEEDEDEELEQNLPKQKSGSPKGGPRTFVEEDSAKEAQDKVFVNPELLRLSRKKKEMTEGCLSVRGKYGAVLRHERASVRAQDEEGNTFTYHAAGLLAQIFQHEVQHLDGILFIDKAVRLWDDPEMRGRE